MRRSHIGIWCFGLIFLLPPLLNCVDLGYLLPALIGQLDLIARSVPIKDAIEDGTLSAEQRSKLMLIEDVRGFARNHIGLHVRDNYTLFFDAGDKPVAYNISASRKDALEPHEWWFPVVGFVPYLGFFNLEAAEARTEMLEAQGYDVYRYEIDAYSLASFFPNPVLSPMLERRDIDLVATVIHELLHSTVWSGDVSFNESLASWVGRTGALQYYADRHPQDPQQQQRVIDFFEDEDRLTEFMFGLLDELEEFYASALSSEEKIIGREAIYQASRDRFAQQVLPEMHFPELFDWVQDMPTNNAYVLGFQRYNLDLDLFEAVFMATAGNWSETLEVFRNAAAAGRDPHSVLETWLSAYESVAREHHQQMTPPPFSRGPCQRRLSTMLLPNED